MLSDSNTDGERNLEKPLDKSVPYATWYPYSSVRKAFKAHEPCQEEVMNAWWETLARYEQAQIPHHLLVNAPTGLGKTISALVPAVAWQQECPHERQVYYLVATVNQHDNPISELKSIYDHCIKPSMQKNLRVVDLVGQRQRYNQATFCLHDERCQETPAKIDLLQGEPKSWLKIAEDALQHNICPYHYLFHSMPAADIVICDYWWIFGQSIQQGRSATSNFSHKDIALIVDEAHNLIPRIRGLRDVTITRTDLVKTLQTCPDPTTREALFPLVDCLLGDGDLAIEAFEVGLSPKQVLDCLDREKIAAAHHYWDRIRKRNSSTHQKEGIRIEENILANLVAFDEDNIVFYTTKEERRGFTPAITLNIRRVDATDDLRLGYEKVKASITLSATLVAPGDSSLELQKLVPQLGLPAIETGFTKVLKAGTPFNAEDKQFWLYDSIPDGQWDTRERFMHYYHNTISHIGKATGSGVTAVFFSSYDFMQKVIETFNPHEQEMILQEKKGDGENTQSDIKSLKDYQNDLVSIEKKHGRAFLFAVYGGKIAQGANFRNEKTKENLIKTVVCIYLPTEMRELFHFRLCQHLWLLLHANEPMPQTAFDRKLNSKFMKLLWKDVWEYAYERPAMYQVLQAAGRGIRSEADRCAFVLIDKKYDTFTWQEFLEPAPYSVSSPHINVQLFHQGDKRFSASGKWEEQLWHIKPI